MTSHGRLPDKERREFRRRNHVARDLRTPKYEPRVVKTKNVEPPEWDDDEDLDFDFDGPTEF